MLQKGLNLKKALLYCGKQAASEKLIIQKCEFWRLISYLLKCYHVFAQEQNFMSLVWWSLSFGILVVGSNLYWLQSK